MKFKIKKKIDEISQFKHKEYNHGDLKEIKKFAFKPKRINDDIMIWLESYYEVYEFQVVLPYSYNHVKQLADSMCLPVIYDRFGWYFKDYKLK